MERDSAWRRLGRTVLYVWPYPFFGPRHLPALRVEALFLSVLAVAVKKVGEEKKEAVLG